MVGTLDPSLSKLSNSPWETRHLHIGENIDRCIFNIRTSGGQCSLAETLHGDPFCGFLRKVLSSSC